MMIERLWLGTVQLGMRYGLATEPMSVAESERILDRAWELGIRKFDTARIYGDSEARIGAWLTRSGHKPAIASKIPDISNIPDVDVAKTVTSAVDASRSALGLDSLDYVLCHNSADFCREAVRDALLSERVDGRIGSIGVSGYSPADVENAIAASEHCQIAQLPASVVDRRLLDSKLCEDPRRRVKYVVRSLFLQGMLLLNRERLPAQFSALGDIVDALHGAARSLGLPVSSLVIAQVLQSLRKVDAVVGVLSCDQLDEFTMISAAYSKVVHCGEDVEHVVSQFLAGPDRALIDPRSWARSTG